jgi:peptidoglycan hydrolase CwlO-like protein
MDEINGKVGEIINRVAKMTQTVNSYSQSIAKLEAQVKKMANILNKREEGKLPS